MSAALCRCSCVITLRHFYIYHAIRIVLSKPLDISIAFCFKLNILCPYEIRFLINVKNNVGIFTRHCLNMHGFDSTYSKSVQTRAEKLSEMKLTFEHTISIPFSLK